MVKEVIEIGHKRAGKEMPDLFKRRGAFRRHKNVKARQAQGAEIMRLYLDGKLLAEIARAISLGHYTVRARIQRLCEQVGEEYVDGRARRKSLDHKISASTGGYKK